MAIGGLISNPEFRFSYRIREFYQESFQNTAGVLAGVFGTAATGYILQRGSWADVFKVAVALYVIGTLVWNWRESS